MLELAAFPIEKLVGKQDQKLVGTESQGHWLWLTAQADFANGPFRRAAGP
jgi:hypothetical protein